MALSIMTNELVLSSRRHLEATNERMHSAIQKLATGSRIVHASDDPAGLAISDGLNAQIRSLGQAMRNAQDGISLIQVFEGGTNEINNMLVRMRELAVQSASDTIGDPERNMLNNEYGQLVEEITRVARSTKFMGNELLSGDRVDVEFQVGAGNNSEVDRIRFSPGDSNLMAESLGVESTSVAERDAARESLDTLDSAITRVNEVRARVGSAQARMHSTLAAQAIYQENLLSAKSRIRDADVAEESANAAKEHILREAGVAVLTQANMAPRFALSLLHSLNG